MDPSVDTTAVPRLKWLNDIRWADAGRARFGDLKDDGAYRVLYDNGYLIVSIQAQKAPGTTNPNEDSRVYFAVGDPTNDRAVAIAINMTASNNRRDGAASPVTAAETWLKDATNRICAGGSNPGTACTMQSQCTGGGTCANNWRRVTTEFQAPPSAWMITPGIWVDEGYASTCVNDTDPSAANKNGRPCIDNDFDGQGDSTECGTLGGVCAATDPLAAIWGANFKIKLDQVGLTPDRALKMFLGAKISSTSPMLSTTFKRKPQVTATPTASLFDTASDVGAMVPRDMTVWADTTAPGADCEGARLTRSKIGRQTMAGNFDLTEIRIGSAVDAQNKLIATTECPAAGGETGPCLPESLSAVFRAANWGTNFNDRGWTPLKNNLLTSEVLMDGSSHFTFDCKPNIAGSETCGLLNAGLVAPKNGYYHQCMAVELSQAPFSTQPIAVGSEYVNTLFQVASTVQNVATIDVRGLANWTGNSADRGVYLFVKRRNMPRPSTRKMYLPRNEMVADRLDVADMYSCPATPGLNVSCVGLEGPVGLCSYACTANGCRAGDARFSVEDQCYCAVGGESAEACYAGGGDNRDPKNSPGDDARITRVWPTYMVQAYFDTGKTVRLKAGTYKVLEAMTEFGMYIDHIGAHYGFTDTLTGLNGLAVTRVAPDVYRVSVKSEKQAQLQVTVTATEDAAPVPLTVLSGVATPFGLFGSVEIVGVSPTTTPLDLRRATVRVDRLISENGRELARNLGAPRQLSPLPGALPTVAIFQNLVGVDVTMEVIELPLIGRLTSVEAWGAIVDRPASCGLFLGSASLDTAFSITDTTNPPYIVATKQNWACIPFVGMTAY